MVPGVPTLLGLPFDAASSFARGAAQAPPLLRAAMRSDASNLWTEQLVDLGVPGRFADAGDASLEGDPRAAMTAAVDRVLDGGGRPLILGGDHAITWPVLQALRPRHPQLSILHLDAHNDLYDHFEGDRGSHACPFARIMEAGLADQLVQVGIRAMTGHQRAQADRFGVEVIDMRAWSRGVRPVLRHPVYISLDLDAIDPSAAPGVSHREPGGLTVREVVDVLHRVTLPVVGADLVEYNPLRDIDQVTATVGGKLLKELLGVMCAAG